MDDFIEAIEFVKEGIDKLGASHLSQNVNLDYKTIQRYYEGLTDLKTNNFMKLYNYLHNNWQSYEV